MIRQKETLFFTEVKTPKLKKILGISILTFVWSTKGLCRVLVGSAHQLQKDAFLKEHFKDFETKASGKNHQVQADRFLRSYLATSSEKPINLPLDLRGSSFQKSVWQALRKIVPGKFTTYGRLAEHLKRPKASRAIGNACGANPLLVVVPCHRVLGSGGNLGGFAVGLPLKKRLLAHEGVEY